MSSPSTSSSASFPRVNGRRASRTSSRSAGSCGGSITPRAACRCAIACASATISFRCRRRAVTYPRNRRRPNTQYAGTAKNGIATSDTTHATAPCDVRTWNSATTAVAMPSTSAAIASQT